MNYMNKVKKSFVYFFASLLLMSSGWLGAETVLVTGANRGIGLEFVRQYAAKGYTVIATTRRTSATDELTSLAKQYPAIRIELLDVTVQQSVDALAAKYKQMPIDILINNAAITPRSESDYQGLAGIDFELARQYQDVNALGPVRVSKAFMSQVAASRLKKIITLSSKAGSFAEGPNMPMMHAYRASKAALNMFMHTIAMETTKQGVTLVMLSPGVVNTTPGFEQPGALEPKESVTKMIAVIDKITTSDNGKFLNYAKGEAIAW
jgi:NAD(P)-dependent dehydrogenase (short-subunit alcohol dehydrogenase family)